MSPSSPPTSPTTASAACPALYKGKIAHRSWQHLPPELIRLIVTHYVLGASATSYCPQIWETRENWHHRMVYTVFREANDLEKLMCVTPSWGSALETHLFWYQACVVMDPTDCFAHHAILRPAPGPNSGSATLPTPLRMTPYRHFRNLALCSCAVCRINSPHTSAGLATATQAKRIYPTLHLGPVSICREHRRQTASFCALCLCSAAPVEAGIIENEDEETWPGIEATCRTCRHEALWRAVKDSPRDREALGMGRNGYWDRERDVDWETRQAIESFIEMGEGCIAELVALAQEKHWLRKYTKISDMLGQALAANRLNSTGGYSPAVEEEEEEEEEDPELMSITEEGGVRELAISDWARNRILDGHWLSPADQWYNHSVPGHPTVVEAVHPCPWTRDIDDYAENGDDVMHPRPSIVSIPTPPSFSLCEHAYIAFQRQMRTVVFPALTNLVRKIVIECNADGVDPALRASRMVIEEVLRALREEEGVWYNGIDWLERRANEERRRHAEEVKEEDTSSSSSKSDGSHTTSPVLSTVTLQTTPSPSPISDKEEGLQVAVPIPVSPVLEAPELLHPIPYVPITSAGMPHYSMEALKIVWREACAPLYHCRCKICERAMLLAGAASGNVVPVQTAPPSAPKRRVEAPKEIVLDEHDGEDEVDRSEERTEATETTERTEEQSEEETDDIEEDLEDDEDLYRVTPRKRPSADLIASSEDGDADADGDAEDEEVDDARPARRSRSRSRSPPKRMRMTADALSHARKRMPATPPRTRYRERASTKESLSLGSSPARLRKRSSEELEGGGVDAVESMKKRIRVRGGAPESDGDGESPPTSSAVETGLDDEDGDGENAVPRQVYNPVGCDAPVLSDDAMAQLYTLEPSALVEEYDT